MSKPKANSSEQTCIAKTLKGEYCRKKAKNGSRYCPIHAKGSASKAAKSIESGSDSDDGYMLPNDSEEVWKHTSRWTEFQVESLKLEVVNTDLTGIIGNVGIESVEITDTIKNIFLLPAVNISFNKTPPEMNRDQIIFYNRVVQIFEFRDEPPTDSIIRYILDYAGFESKTLHFRAKPTTKMKWKSHKISSVPDLAVYPDRSRGGTIIQYLMVVEAKRKNISSALQPERQLCGEMLVSAYNRASLQMVDQAIYGIIVTGHQIRFYRSNFNTDYLRSITRNLNPDLPVKIYRYPSDTERALIITDPDDRKKIAAIVCKIRELIEEL